MLELGIPVCVRELLTIRQWKDNKHHGSWRLVHETSSGAHSQKGMTHSTSKVLKQPMELHLTKSPPPFQTHTRNNVFRFLIDMDGPDRELNSVHTSLADFTGFEQRVPLRQETGYSSRFDKCFLSIIHISGTPHPSFHIA